MSLAGVWEVWECLRDRVFRDRVAHAGCLNIILVIFLLYFRSTVWPNH